MQARSNSARGLGKKISFVPTMGYLHEGHLTLLREGRKSGDDLVLSIFVNPTQFGPDEDLDSYPSNLERDFEFAEKEGVDAIFTPTGEQLYGENYQTYVTLEKLPNHLCGISRPIHFRGVATVVTKLFNIVKPHVAVFGKKDFQQLAVIRQMVKDLNFDIEIIGVDTVREKDGLAMSSRNSYLSNPERRSALSLSLAMAKAQELVDGGEKKTNVVLEKLKQFIEAYEGTCIDYLSICDPVTLEDTIEINKDVLFALAVKVGKTRLIDNCLLTVNS